MLLLLFAAAAAQDVPQPAALGSQARSVTEGLPRIAPPAPPPAELGVRPASSPAGWVTQDDYPAVALRNNWQGIVHFTLDVGDDGRVTGCTIRRSSGWPVLDSTSCALLKKRATFRPAAGVSALPEGAQYSSRIRWQFPDVGGQPFEAWARLTRFTLSPDGHVIGCTSQAVGPAPREEDACAGAREMPRDRVAELRAAASGPVSIAVVETHVPEGQSLPGAFVRPAGSPVLEMRMRLTVGFDGFVRACTPKAIERVPGFHTMGPTCAPPWSYAPDRAGGFAPDRHVMREFSVLRAGETLASRF